MRESIFAGPSCRAVVQCGRVAPPSRRAVARASRPRARTSKALKELLKVSSRHSGFSRKAAQERSPLPALSLSKGRKTWEGKQGKEQAPAGAKEQFSRSLALRQS